MTIRPILVALGITVFAQGAQAAECARNITNSTKVTELLQCIVKLNAEVEALAAASAIPSDAVVAFDSPRGCPVGWSPFSQADGRMIIGATTGKSGLSRRFYGEEGGAESVALDQRQLPRHAHPPAEGMAHVWVFEDKARGNLNMDPRFNPNTMGGWFHRDSAIQTGEAGGGQPHDNMSPYLALYFCKKN